MKRKIFSKITTDLFKEFNEFLLKLGDERTSDVEYDYYEETQRLEVCSSNEYVLNWGTWKWTRNKFLDNLIAKGF